MKKQLKSFWCAFSGILYAIKNEGHFRFHIVAALYVVCFGLKFYNFTKTQWAVIAVVIGLVTAFEALNTALENLCDAVTKSQNPLIKTAKDCAAGAVLLSAGAAVTVAFLFFWNTQTFYEIFLYYANNIFRLILLLISAVLSVIFIMLKPFGKMRNKGMKNDEQ